MRQKISTLLALLLAAPLCAQDLDPSLDFISHHDGFVENTMKSPLQGQDHAADIRVGAMRAALNKMECGGELGQKTAAYVSENKVAVVFEPLSEYSTHYTDEDTGKLVIALSDALPADEAVIGARLAKEVSDMTLESDIPESSEKSYMNLSAEVRAWLELGGRRGALPKDKELAARYGIWLNNNQEMALYKIGEAEMKNELYVIKSHFDSEIKKRPSGDPVRQVMEKMSAALVTAEKSFTGFLIAENDWRNAYPHLMR